MINISGHIQPIYKLNDIEADISIMNEKVIVYSSLNRSTIKLLCQHVSTVPKKQAYISEFRQFTSFGIANYKRHNYIASHFANNMDPNYYYYIIGDCYIIFREAITLDSFNEFIG